MQSSNKTKLLLIPFLAGLILLIWSWFLSFPISTSSANDYVYNHISIFYWISLPLLTASMFLMALRVENHILKWLLSIGIVLTFFSLAYFYSMMPTSDSHFFRGLSEYFIKTKSLDASQLNHEYYQWPAYFVLADIVTSVSGVPLAIYEFLLYAIIGILLATGLYVYASRKYKMAGLLTVVAFFLSITYFIDYQAVPFSLALGFLFTLFMLETRRKTPGLVVLMVVLYVGLLLSHLFVPLFFVLYLFARSLVDKNRKNRSLYGYLFLFALVSYALVELTFAKFSLTLIFTNITKAPAQYSYIVSSTIASIPIPVNVVAQYFSRTVTIAAVITCVIGAILLLIKKELRTIDKAIFTIGMVYTLLGTVLNTLGERALAILFIPISLGAAYLFKGRFKKYLVGLLLVLIILFTFIPLHLSFNTEIQFQTKETYTADNFFLDHYNWQNPGLVVADFRTNTYLTAKLSVTQNIEPWLNAGDKAAGVLYTPQFVGSQLGNYSSMQNLAQGTQLDILYNDGSSFILINANR
jgi:hypothetical protein